jgi:putative ABC transport system permease protein
MDKSRLSWRDLVGEAVSGVLQRPGRSILTMLGTVLGIGAMVGILGLTTTAGGQIDKRFTALAATEVTVEDQGATASDAGPGMSFPPDSDTRIRQINGVVHGGLLWPLPLRQPTVSGVPELNTDSGGLGLYAADPDALAALHPVLQTGRLFDAFHVNRRERVAVLGSGAARRLGITSLDTMPAVFIDGSTYTVIGIISDLQRLPELLLSVILPSSTALAAYGPPTDEPAEMVIETRLGAAKVVADQAALALRPDAPDKLRAIAPADPQTLRGGVTSDLNVLFVLLAGITLVIGGVSIANTTFVAVLERTNEIGLRRSLGARPRHIAAHFLAESAALGTLGGLVGTSLGVVFVVGVALAQQWTAILEPWTVLPAPAAGTIVGVAAGLYPAIRAAKVEPVEALRR